MSRPRLYLVVKDIEQHALAARRVPLSFSAMPGALATMRELVQSVRPGRQIVSPLESVAAGMVPEVLTVYTSPNRDGIGRAGSHVWLWAVEPEPATAQVG
jgi:hypothetical protein